MATRTDLDAIVAGDGTSRAVLSTYYILAVRGGLSGRNLFHVFSTSRP